MLTEFADFIGAAEALVQGNQRGGFAVQGGSEIIINGEACLFFDGLIHVAENGKSCIAVTES